MQAQPARVAQLARMACAGTSFTGTRVKTGKADTFKCTLAGRASNLRQARRIKCGLAWYAFGCRPVMVCTGEALLLCAPNPPACAPCHGAPCLGQRTLLSSVPQASCDIVVRGRTLLFPVRRVQVTLLFGAEKLAVFCAAGFT